MEVSTVGDPHTLAPVHPLGAVNNVCRIAPFVARIETIFARISGQSPKEATPS